MTDDVSSFDSDDMTGDQALALDFAIGGLDRAERVEAQLRLHRDPPFKAEVEHWQSLLGPLAAEVAPVTPPPLLWERVASEIAPVPRREALPSAQPSWWASLGLWRTLTLSSTALAAVAAILLVSRPATPPVEQLLVATLASPAGAALLTATYDASRGAVILTPAGKSESDGRTPELWVIEGDNPPRSLGTIDISAPGSHAIPADRLRGLRAGSTLAISLEPSGGSPTGAPTGPVVATGKLTGI